MLGSGKMFEKDRVTHETSVNKRALLSCSRLIVGEYDLYLQVGAVHWQSLCKSKTQLSPLLSVPVSQNIQGIDSHRMLMRNMIVRNLESK